MSLRERAIQAAKEHRERKEQERATAEESVAAVARQYVSHLLEVPMPEVEVRKVMVDDHNPPPHGDKLYRAGYDVMVRVDPDGIRLVVKVGWRHGLGNTFRLYAHRMHLGDGTPIRSLADLGYALEKEERA